MLDLCLRCPSHARVPKGGAHPMSGCPRGDAHNRTVPPNPCQGYPRFPTPCQGCSPHPGVTQPLPKPPPGCPSSARLPTRCQGTQGLMTAPRCCHPTSAKSHPDGCPPHARVPKGRCWWYPTCGKATSRCPPSRQGALRGPHPLPGCSWRFRPHATVLSEVLTPPLGALGGAQPTPRCTWWGSYPYQKLLWWCPPHPRVPLRSPTPRVPPPMPFPHPSCPWDRRSRRRRRDRGRWPR